MKSIRATALILALFAGAVLVNDAFAGRFFFRGGGNSCAGGACGTSAPESTQIMQLVNGQAQPSQWAYAPRYPVVEYHPVAAFNAMPGEFGPAPPLRQHHFAPRLRLRR